MPDSPEKVGEELVWWRILLDRVPAPATVGSAEFGEEGLTLADRFRIATVGYLDQAPAPPPSPAASEVPADLALLFDERRADVDATLAHALRRVLGPDIDPWALTSTRLFVAGLSLEVCAGSVPSEQVPDLVRRHVQRLTTASGP